MFERFTDRARRSVVLAQEEARGFNHNYIGTEHLLLGLMREGEGVAFQALKAVGLDLERLRAELDKRVGRGASTPKGHIPFTPRAKKVLELGLRQALQLGHNYIGTEHVLLGLLREGEGVAAQILITDVDGGLEKVRDEVMKLLDLTPSAREHLRRAGELTGVKIGVGADDEIVKRLEAIEARLSAIERLLRDQRGESEVS